MIGFKLNEDGDIYREDGKISLLSTVQEYVRQSLQIKFRAFQTEWFLDQSFGMPYLNNFTGGPTILSKGMSQADIDALFVFETRRNPEVIKIEFFRSEYNAYTRSYDTTFEVVTRDGLLRANVPSLLPYQEVTYPTPTGNEIESSCGFDIFSDVLQLHPIIHEYLPYGSEFGWLGDLDFGLNT